MSLNRLKVSIYLSFQSILPECSDVPKHQQKAQESSTTVDYQSELHIMSRAARIRLTGIVCTIGKFVFRFFIK